MIVSAAAVAKGDVCPHVSGSTVLAVRSCSLVRVLDAPTRQRHHVRRRPGVIHRPGVICTVAAVARRGRESCTGGPLRFLVIFEYGRLMP